MNARVAYCFFLTAVMGGLIYLLILHPVTLSQDARAIIEMVLGGLGTILMHVVTSVFHIPSPVNPTQPATPAQQVKP
jgi:hypothetical protein